LRKKGAESEYKDFVNSGQGLFDLLCDVNTIRTTQLDDHLTNITNQMIMTNIKLDTIIEELRFLCEELSKRK
jgi:hypothetical protein